MRKPFTFVAALAALLSGCSKHNVGNPYYFIFQSGAITYSTPVVDSLLLCRDTTTNSYGIITMASYRTQAQTDSAAAGLTKLATWSFYLWNRNAPFNDFAGAYSTDTGAANARRLDTLSDVKFYTSYDPHQGSYYPKAGLQFTVTITQYTSTWFEGTFTGQVAGMNITTREADTATITNGKFKLPFAN
jgi:hypothetical protein